MKMFSLALALSLVSSMACAADFSTPLFQLDGKTALTAPGDTAGSTTPVTLGYVAEISLLTEYKDEVAEGKVEDVTRQKIVRWALAKKIHGAGEVALTADETTLLKRLIGKNYPPLVAGQAWSILDPASIPK